MQEGGLMMLLHSVLIGVFLYILMKFLLKQSSKVAEDRSIFLGALVLLYMVMFGHGMPKKINSRLNPF
jgi:hypothetical protein